ncbi:MAG TPA: aldo/keto reductase [Candidatus Dormibacteraeota bacterium]|nr:aldo/keto reductase [Candidatus Dormibacteraeota bacterium]
MKTKRLGNSDLYITPVGFGAWAIGGAGWEFGWGDQDDKDSIAAIHRALELGVNWIDTAAVYGMGHSEEVVASALSSCSGTRPYVFTKCGLLGDEQGYVHRNLRANSIRRECENSLRRLKVDAIDLYQIHWPSEDLEEGWGEMARLQKEGKVRWIGVSNFDASQLRRAERIAPVTSLQPPYSLVRREIEPDILPYCQSHGIGVIVYSPMQSGLLTGAMTRERVEKLPDSDWRSRDPEFREPKLSKNLALVERLRKVGQKYGAPPGQVAVAWVLRNPAVTAAIVGARSSQQVEQNVGAADLHLSDEDVAEIEGINEQKLVNAA